MHGRPIVNFWFDDASDYERIITCVDIIFHILSFLRVTDCGSVCFFFPKSKKISCDTSFIIRKVLGVCFDLDVT